MYNINKKSILWNKNTKNPKFYISKIFFRGIKLRWLTWRVACYFRGYEVPLVQSSSGFPAGLIELTDKALVIDEAQL